MDRSRFTSSTFGTVRPQIGAEPYDVFVPAPLPRSVDLAPPAIALLSEADAALGRLAGVARVLPEPTLLIAPYVVREAVASSAIEGTQASVADVLEIADRRQEARGDLREVVNHIDAVERGIELLGELPLTVRLMREMHERLLTGVRGGEWRPGELRQSQNWIGGRSLADAVFVPPPHDEVTRLLGDWERMANDPPPHMPVLVQTALLHYQFETIHPFLDGNGRMGRALIGLHLIAKDRLPGPILYVSPFIERHRQQYYDRLQAVREVADLDAWLCFFFEAVRVQAIDAVERAERLFDLREELRSMVMSETRGHAVAVVDLLFRYPAIDSAVVVRELGVTQQGAGQVLGRLEEIGVLTPHAPGRHGRRRWLARRIVDVVSEE